MGVTLWKIGLKENVSFNPIFVITSLTSQIVAPQELELVHEPSYHSPKTALQAILGSQTTHPLQKPGLVSYP